MEIATLLIALAALAVAYLAMSRANVASRGLSQTQERLAEMQSELKETRAALQARLDDMGRETRRQAGTLKFTPGMTIAEVMQMHPRAADVLAEFQLGGCSNCPVSDVDTIEGACRSYGIDQAALMAALNRLVDSKAEDAAAVGAGTKPIDVTKMRVRM